MAPREFIEKWRDNPLKERASYQMHFLDLCVLLGVDPPAPSSHETYCFERGATRTGAGQGWADVWKRGHFGFEYKSLHRSLAEALKQLMTYALALDNPPLLVVCDTSTIEIHTHFTNAPSEVHTIALEEIGEPANLEKLRWLFTDPDKFHPGRTIAQITEEAAGKFAALAQSLNSRGHDPQTVAHFLNQCLFCLFAEDAGLLPGRLFERLLDKSQTDPAKLSSRFEELFKAMRRGGDFALEDIHWFNGGLFEQVEVLPLELREIKMLRAAAMLDWSGIEPSIFGTLFERGLDPKKRTQLGAHYTDPQSILRIINPVIVEPLSAEWEAARARITGHIARRKKSSDKAEREAQAVFTAYLERLKKFKVLDPACGSGNFLYLALRALKDLEHKANLDAEALGLQRQITIECSPANVLGIELNPYAAELARVTVWIGEIQWMLKNGYPIRKNPILQPLDHIENRDALLAVLPAQAGTQPIEKLDSRFRGNDKTVVEPDWPTVDAIIGNPPFLGGSKVRGELGDEYTGALRKVYEGRVPGGADLVTYWFEKARTQIEAGKCQRAGLVATNSIRGGANQQVLARILNTAVIPAQAGIQSIEKLDSGLRRNDKAMQIFNAWSDEEWVNEGAAVRVSLVCFGLPPFVGWVSPQGVTQHSDVQSTPSVGLRDKAANPTYECLLNGQSVAAIHADLTAGEGLNLTQAKPLKENAGVCFMGASKKAPFDIPGELARQWLKLPNPNGRPNSDVVRPWANGMDITRRASDTWIIDFGTTMSEADAALYETPFEYVVQYIKPEREKNNREAYRKYWWRHAEARPGMRAALKNLPRYIATPHVSKHRVFVWVDAAVLPDQMLIVTARTDDETFGILHSRFHELWALRMGTSLEDRPRYTPTTTFETFPFPEGLTPKDTSPQTPSGATTSHIWTPPELQ
ncbi:MAG: class I SAM-dependent DNA methyltransferase [Nitrosomonadales bacterium]|nr:class I SAM-dependent DNA methyltransferase [Nitrosomonadales bacterium]